MRLKLLQVFIAFGTVFNVSARAELKWSATELTLHPSPGAELVEADFDYSNSGQTPVAIIEVTPSCGCVKAEATMRMVAPGQSGKIHAVFKTAGASGHVTKSIRVFTDQVGVAPSTLHLGIDLTPPYVVCPRRLHWKLHEPAASKEIEISVAAGTTLGEPILKTSPVGFEYSMTHVSNRPGHFRLTVTPKTTEVVQRGVVTLEFSGATSPEMKPHVLIAVE